MAVPSIGPFPLQAFKSPHTHAVIQKPESLNKKSSDVSQ